MTNDAVFNALLREAFSLPPGPGPIDLDAWMRCLRCGKEGRSATSVCPHDGGPMVPEGDSRLGQLVGEYRILELLGAGGGGAVYRARHRSLLREAAVKFLRGDAAQLREQRARLTREAHVLGQLDHEHIVRVLDLWVTPTANPVLVMELVRGRNLDQALAEDGVFAPGRAVHVVRQVACALARAHALGILHRDIKPSNLRLTRVRGDEDYVKVLDFGMARVPTELRLTQSCAVVGTPRYMSPEQASGAPLTPASDLYSLGCVLFELLAGSPPFAGSSAVVMHAHVKLSPPPLRNLSAAVPQALAAVVDRLLDKRPERRFANAPQLLQALDRVAPELPDHAGSVTTPRLYAPAAPGMELDRRLSRRLLSLARPSIPATTSHASRLEAGASQALGALQTARRALDEAQGSADEAQRDHRGRAAQLHRAFDAIRADLAEASERLEVAEAVREASDCRREVALERACIAATAVQDTSLEAILSLAHDEVIAVRALLDSVFSLREIRAQHRAASARAAEAKARCADLSFQVDQLRARRAGMEVEARAESDAAQIRLSSLQARYDACLEAAVVVVERAAEGMQPTARAE